MKGILVRVFSSESLWFSSLSCCFIFSFAGIVLDLISSNRHYSLPVTWSTSAKHSSKSNRGRKKRHAHGHDSNEIEGCSISEVFNHEYSDKGGRRIQQPLTDSSPKKEHSADEVELNFPVNLPSLPLPEQEAC